MRWDGLPMPIGGQFTPAVCEENCILFICRLENLTSSPYDSANPSCAHTARGQLVLGELDLTFLACVP